MQCQNKIDGIQCTNKATDKHHLLSQTKLNRKLYGKLLDSKENIIYLCNDCHLNKSIVKQNEKEFCNIFGIEIQSKSGQEIRQIK